MGNLSIVTRITAYTFLTMALLLMISSFFLIQLEKKKEKATFDHYISKIYQQLDEREKSEKFNLLRKLKNDMELLNVICLDYLYNIDSEGLKASLKLYMKNPEILAVKVLDEDDNYFVALWNQNNVINSGNQFPKDLILDEHLSHRVNTIYEEKKIGSIQIYYTHKFLTEKINKIREETLTEKKELQESSKLRLRENIINLGFILFIILVFQVIILFVLIKKVVLNPVFKISQLIDIIGNRDLTIKIENKKNDELGLLVSSIDKIVIEFRNSLQNVQTKSQDLSKSSRQMLEISSKMSKNTGNMLKQSNEAVTLSDEMTDGLSAITNVTQNMSENINNISTTSSELSNNFNQVTKTIEKILLSMKKIESRVNKGSDTAYEASQMAVTAVETMETLMDSAIEIANVTEIIKQISHKTDLLAINAAIEAETAGDAGRGFSVVVNEITSFANHSQQAAEDIFNRIKKVTESTERAVSAISNISNIVNDINLTSEEIKTSVEKQTKSINDISTSVNSFDEGTNYIASSIAEISKAAREVSKNAVEVEKSAKQVNKNINNVKDIANEGNENGLQVRNAADRISQMSDDLKKLVEVFKI